MRISKYHFLLVIVLYFTAVPVSFGQAQDKPDSKADRPLKILSRPRAEYSEEAKRNVPNFNLRLLIELRSDNTIGDVVCLNEDYETRRKMEEYGIISAFIDAAKKITFEAAIKNGEAITVKKRIEYTYSVY